MFKIETDHGTYEADTEKEAMKAMRAGARRDRKERDAREAKARVAHLRAKANGFDILTRVQGDEGIPRGWRYYPIGHKHGACQHAGEQDPYSCKRSVRFEAEGGSVTESFYGYEVLGALTNGAGFCTAFWLQDTNDRTRPPEAYALGVEDGIAAWVQLPALAPSLFIHEQAEKSA